MNDSLAIVFRFGASNFAKEVALQVAHALSYSHSCGIAHRDGALCVSKTDDNARACQRRGAAQLQTCATILVNSLTHLTKTISRSNLRHVLIKHIVLGRSETRECLAFR